VKINAKRGVHEWGRGGCMCVFVFGHACVCMTVHLTASKSMRVCFHSCVQASAPVSREIVSPIRKSPLERNKVSPRA